MVTSLRALHTTQREIAGQRIDIGADACELAYKLLNQAEEEGFRNKQLVRQAAEQFVRAIRFRRRDPEAYVGLGYLLSLLSDFDTSLKYLREALKLDPDRQDAKQLIEFVLEQKANPGLQGPVTPVVAAPDQGAIEAIDELYERIEEQLYYGIHELVKTPPPQPIFETQAYEELRELCQNQQRAIQNFHNHLIILDREMDVSSLQRQLRSYEQMCRRFVTALETSHYFQTLRKEVDLLRQQVALSFRNLQQNRSPALLKQTEHELEGYMDRCDRIADSLDHIQNKGFDLGGLERAYEFLVMLIEQLKEQLDE